MNCWSKKRSTKRRSQRRRAAASYRPSKAWEARNRIFRGPAPRRKQRPEEEVVELVRAQDLLGLLDDGSVGARRDQLRERRGWRGCGPGPSRSAPEARRDATQPRRRRTRVLGTPPFTLYIAMWSPRERAPAQGQLREIPRADHQASLLVGEVHQDLRALAGLEVLVGGALRVGGVEADVANVLGAGGADVDLPQRHAEGGRRARARCRGSLRSCPGRASSRR